MFSCNGIRASCVAAALLLGGAGCGSSSSGRPSGMAAAPATMSGDFMRPLDSVPSSDGNTLYFIAMSGDGQPAIFRVPRAGGAAVALAMGAPLVSPVGIALSGDDATLYIADPISDVGGASDEAAAASPSTRGGIFTLATAGGTPSLLPGTADTMPRGIDVAKEGSSDTIYFSGVDGSGAPGVFKVGAGGGMPVAIAVGEPFVDPSGVAVAKSGTVYVANTSSAESSRASIVKVAGGVAADFITGIRAGFPAGIALTSDDKTLLVSAHDLGSNGDIVLAVDVANQTTTAFNDGIEMNGDGGGLHRARGRDLFSWADTSAGPRGAGLVYAVSLK